MSYQLDLAGGSTPLADLQPQRARGLTRQQHAILEHLREHGTITSTQAGRIVHGYRPMPHWVQRLGPEPGECPRHAAKRLANVVPAAAASDRWPGENATACCPWAATDGGPALKRMATAGLVARHPERRGTWVLPDTPDTL